MPNHIQLARLETKAWTCTVTTDGVAQDLSASTISFTVKRNYSDSDASALFKLTGTFGTAAGITFSDSYTYCLAIGSTYTQSVTISGVNEKYHFDHRVQLPSGSIKVLEQGEFIVTPNVTESMT